MDERDAYEVLQVHPRAEQLVIRAAYRVLASVYHPDRDASQAAPRRMPELNTAYDKVRSPDLHRAYDRLRTQPSSQTSPIVPPPPRSGPDRAANEQSGVLAFGRYSGWTIRQFARQDQDYLRWLSRHSSGIRYRREIEIALRQTAAPAAHAPRSRHAR